MLIKVFGERNYDIVRSIAFSPDGKRLAIARLQAEAEFSDAENGEKLPYAWGGKCQDDRSCILLIV